MTGTERAAMRLALGVLRQEIAAKSGGLRGAKLGFLRACGFFGGEGDDRAGRCYRARVALYIRAVLRAERGDAELEHGGRSEDWPGSWRCYSRLANDVPLVCSECAEPLGYFAGYDEGDAVTNACPVTGRAAVVRRPIPLWQGGVGAGR